MTAELSQQNDIIAMSLKQDVEDLDTKILASLNGNIQVPPQTRRVQLVPALDKKWAGLDLGATLLERTVKSLSRRS